MPLCLCASAYSAEPASVQHVFIPDASASDGSGKTGLTYSGITAYYNRSGGTLTALILEDISTLGTWASTGDNKLGFKEVSAANAPGLYELNLPVNMLASGAPFVAVQLRATGAAPTQIKIDLPASRTYCVRKTGNDTSGNGSCEKPWLTVHKALTTCASGDVVKLGTGTYSENSGSNYLTLPTTFTRYVTVESESGNPQDVTLQGNGGSYNIAIWGGAAYVRFLKVTLTNNLTTQDVIRMTVANHIRFEGCRFLINGTAQAVCAINGAYSGAGATEDVVYQDCEFTQTGSYACWGIYHGTTSAGFTMSRIEQIGCKVRTIGDCLILSGVADLKIAGGTYQCDKADSVAHTIQLGVDGNPTTIYTTGVVQDCRIYSRFAHNLSIGAGCRDVLATRNEIHGGYYGVVLKNCGGSGHPVYLTNNTIANGFAYGILVKAGQYCTITGNRIDQNSAYTGAAGWALGCTYDSTPVPNTNYGYLTFCNNDIHCGQAARALYIVDGQEDGTGSVFDYNNYLFDGATNYGTVKASSAVTTLAGVRAAWDTAYGGSTNEDNSWELPAAAYTSIASIALPTSPTSGSIGALVKTNLDAASSAIKAKTDILPTSFPTNFSSLDIAATGEVGLDFSNVKQATGATTLNNISLGGSVASVTGAVGSVTGAVGSVTDGVTLAADQAVNASKIGGAVVTSLGPIGIRSYLGNSGNFLDVDSSGKIKLSAGAISQTAFSADAISATCLSSAAAAEIAGAVLDEPVGSHTGVLAGVATDFYTGQINFSRSSGSKDQYEIGWFKNGVPITSGTITSVVLQVVKRADGTDLVAATDITANEVGSTRTYKLNVTASGSRLSAGEAALAIVTATIDGSTRTWRRWIGRDFQ